MGARVVWSRCFGSAGKCERAVAYAMVVTWLACLSADLSRLREFRTSFTLLEAYCNLDKLR
jgi:hypothetical protein